MAGMQALGESSGASKERTAHAQGATGSASPNSATSAPQSADAGNNPASCGDHMRALEHLKALKVRPPISKRVFFCDRKSQGAKSPLALQCTGGV